MRNGSVDRPGTRLLGVGLSCLLVVAAAVPAAGSRVENAVSSLGHDALAILDFVASGIRYEPYDGVLRGAEGTLASRAGNSADQAVLLATLLEQAGIEHRFALGPIDDALASAMLDSAILDAQAVRRVAEEAMTSPSDSSTARSTLREDGSEGGPPRGPSEAAANLLEEWSMEALQSTIETITVALEAADIDVADGFSDVPPVERERHVWVQAHTGDTWVDLDPTLAVIGAGPVEPEETRASLPDELFHRLELAIVAEVLKDDELETDELLSISGTASELTGRPMLVANVDEASLPTLAQRFESVLATTTYRPVIVFDSDSYVGAPMMIDGSESGDQGLGGGFFSVDTGSVATAQWVELRLTAPGSEEVTIRRNTFDRIPPGVRERGIVTSDDVLPFEMVDLGGEVGRVPAALRSASWIAIETGLPSLDAPVMRVPPEDPAAFAKLPFSHHVLTEIIGHKVADEHGIRPFPQGPNVTALTLEVGTDPAGLPKAGLVYDIWHRERGALPVTGQSSGLNPRAVPGVLAHLTERLLSVGVGRDDTANDGSVGALFEVAAAEGIGLRVLTSADEVERLGLPSRAHAELLQGLDGGFVAVVPEVGVPIAGDLRLGWWLVDPKTGRVADEMDDGRGISATADAVFKLSSVAALAFSMCLVVEAFPLALDYPDYWRRLPTFSAELRAQRRWWLNRAQECVGL